MTNQNDSDPLPFGQIDRAAKAIAARVAGRYEVTFQHALGSLSEFWDLNGDPRALLTLIKSGKTEVVLDEKEVVRRFQLASGKVADPLDLTALGILEKRNDGFRVRGMSRFFAPLLKREKNKVNAREGGKKSAESRKKKSGSAVPAGASNGGESKKKKAQDELPGIPPAPLKQRQLSEQEEAYRDYHETRQIILVDEMKLDFIPDLGPGGKPHNPAYINSVLSDVLKDCKTIPGGNGWEQLTTLWFDQKWAAKMDPPFPFSAFVSRKVLDGEPASGDKPARPGLLERLRK